MRRGHRAQAFAETMLALPIFLLLLFMTVDVARACYTWVMLGQDAEFAARQVSLGDNQSSDCSAITGTVSSGNGVSISADPKSVVGDGDPKTPSSYTTPSTANTGYVYIYPAMATATPPASNCTGSGARTTRHGTVTVVVTYDFVPWTPLASALIPSVMLTAQAQEQAQW